MGSVTMRLSRSEAPPTGRRRQRTRGFGHGHAGGGGAEGAGTGRRSAAATARCAAGQAGRQAGPLSLGGRAALDTVHSDSRPPEPRG